MGRIRIRNKVVAYASGETIATTTTTFIPGTALFGHNTERSDLTGGAHILRLRAAAATRSRCSPLLRTLVVSLWAHLVKVRAHKRRRYRVGSVMVMMFATCYVLRLCR